MNEEQRKILEQKAKEYGECVASATIEEGINYGEYIQLKNAFMAGAEATWGMLSDENSRMRAALEKIARGPLNLVHTVYPRCYCDACKSPVELAIDALKSPQASATDEGADRWLADLKKGPKD